MSAPHSVSIENLSGDAHPHLRRLRELGPVTWVPAINGWLVTGWSAALAVLKDAGTFTVDDPRFTTGQVVGPSMLSTDGAAHGRHRTPFVGPFRPSAMRADLEGWIGQRARALVADLPRSGPVELRTQLAAPLAVDAIIEALGLRDVANRDTVLAWYRDIVASVAEVTAGHQVTVAGTAAMDALGTAVKAAIEHRTPPLSGIATDSDLNSSEIVSNLAVVMFGAIETSEGMIANLLYHLLSEPGLWAAVQGDSGLVPAAIEESLRMEPAAAIVDRYATVDVSIAGVEVRAGDYVSVSLAGANRDPAVFAEADTFDLDRENSRDHLAFVRGPHACIGAAMSRIEAAAALRAMLELDYIAFDAGASSAPTGHVFRKSAFVVVTIAGATGQPYS